VSDLKIQNIQNTLVIVRNVKLELVRNEGESITIAINFFMGVLHKLLEEFNIIFREKQWILKDLVEKQWPYCLIMI
jgi:hypothetical protein